MRHIMLVLAILAGCASPRQAAEQDTDRAIRTYSSSCQKLGFKSGTPEFGQCILKMRERPPED